VRLLSIAKKLEPPIACSIVMTTNSASARSLGAAWMVMRSRRSRTISAIGSSACAAMTCEEAATIAPPER
jgi:hypothetical protein